MSRGRAMTDVKKGKSLDVPQLDTLPNTRLLALLLGARTLLGAPGLTTRSMKLWGRDMRRWMTMAIARRLARCEPHGVMVVRTPAVSWAASRPPRPWRPTSKSARPAVSKRKGPSSWGSNHKKLLIFFRVWSVFHEDSVYLSI